MWLGDIVKGGITGLIDSIADTADRFITTGDEKQKFKIELLKIQHTKENEILNMISEAEKSITDRHKADMMSDSWLSKNVRPMVLVYLLTAFTMFALGNKYFQIKAEYVGMLKEMLEVVFKFYFVGRSVEKIIGMVKGSKK